jgi:hypothetical protein
MNMEQFMEQEYVGKTTTKLGEDLPQCHSECILKK